MSIMKLTATTAAIALTATTVAARDNVQVAGSSTVLPYASIVAEAFGENFDFPTPVVESGGSSAGLARFCEGVGENTIDIANASRANPPGRNRGMRCKRRDRHHRGPDRIRRNRLRQPA